MDGGAVAEEPVDDWRASPEIADHNLEALKSLLSEADEMIGDEQWPEIKRREDVLALLGRHAWAGFLQLLATWGVDIGDGPTRIIVDGLEIQHAVYLKPNTTVLCDKRDGRKDLKLEDLELRHLGFMAERGCDEPEDS